MSRTPFRAFGLEAAPGTQVAGSVAVGELNTGTTMTIPVRLLHGVADGPVVGMNAMLHGDEVNGYAVVNRLFDALEPQDVSGTLIGIPVANPFALMTNQRISNLEYERLNLNRVFPGSAEGFQMERLADLLFREGVLRSDAWLDFHEGGRDFVARYLIVGTDGSDDEGVARDLRLAHWFGQGVPITVVTISPEMARLARGGAITVQARAAGKAALGIELGGGGRLWDDFVETGVEGAQRILRGLGVLAGGPPEIDDSQFVCHESTWPRPSRGGFFEQDVTLGEVVEAGAIVGRVRNLLGEVVDEVRAPFRSVITDTRHTATIQTGEWSVKCARVPDA
jgi:predicted deacylase